MLTGIAAADIAVGAVLLVWALAVLALGVYSYRSPR
jgi:hypothetical protein